MHRHIPYFISLICHFRGARIRIQKRQINADPDPKRCLDFYTRMSLSSNFSSSSWCRYRTSFTSWKDRLALHGLPLLLLFLTLTLSFLLLAKDMYSSISSRVIHILEKLCIDHILGTHHTQFVHTWF